MCSSFGMGESMIELSCAIQLPRFFKSKEEGRQFLELLLACFPEHVPHKFGSYEPLRKRFAADNLDAALREWGGWGFIAQRRMPVLYLGVIHGVESVRPRHTNIGVYSFEAADWSHVSAVRAFCVQAVQNWNADLAVAHILTRAELAERIDHLKTMPGSNPGYILRRVEREGFAKVLSGMTAARFGGLQSGLADLPWLAIFGQPYIEMFGRERLESTPAHEVLTLSNGSVLVNPARDIPDTEIGWATFRNARDRCMQHLGMEAFIRTLAHGARAERVPQFRFPVEMYKPKALA